MIIVIILHHRQEIHAAILKGSQGLLMSWDQVLSSKSWPPQTIFGGVATSHRQTGSLLRAQAHCITQRNCRASHQRSFMIKTFFFKCDIDAKDLHFVNISKQTRWNCPGGYAPGVLCGKLAGNDIVSCKMACTRVCILLPWRRQRYPPPKSRSPPRLAPRLTHPLGSFRHVALRSVLPWRKPHFFLLFGWFGSCSPRNHRKRDKTSKGSKRHQVCIHAPKMRPRTAPG